MFKKAALLGNLVYILIFLIILIGGIVAIGLMKRGAGSWADQTAKELTREINLAQPNQTVYFDAQRATEIAHSEGMPYNKIFEFDNANSRVCVTLSFGVKTCHTYFNNVDIISKGIKFGVPGNVLIFDIIEKQRSDEAG